MSILAAVTDTVGLVGYVPRIVRINCNDSLTTVVAQNYLLPLVNSQNLALTSTDMVLLSFSGGVGLFDVTLSGGNVTLNQIILGNAGLPILSSTNAITAHAGGGQTSATAITAALNRITTVATAADSVLLPASSAGLFVTITNDSGGNSANVYPRSGDQINDLGANNAFALADNKTATFYCVVAGQWNSILTA